MCIAGIHATFDISKAIGNRVSDVEIRCARCKIPIYKKLDKSKVYKV